FISSYPLSESQEQVLSKGLNFVPSPRSLPVLDLVASLEHSLEHVDPHHSNVIKHGISHILSHYKFKPQHNLTPFERSTLNQLRSNPDLIITRADKGNVVVLLDSSKYKETVLALLSNSHLYKPLRSDPTSRLRKDLRSLLDSFALETQDAELSKIHNPLRFSSNIRPPELYCLPKIHKPDIPLRPIVSSYNSMVSELCNYLKTIFRPLTGHLPSHVPNSTTFCSEIRQITLSPDDYLVSYDTKGAPMGSPLSPILADIFMEHLEKLAFSTADPSILPSFFKRYVDDIFAITKKGTETSFLHHLNSLFPNQITFTMEVESQSRLSFLDILILKGSSSLHTTVYRKPTHSDKYLHFNSHHPKSVKIGIISNLVNRALSICEPQYLPTELQHIENVLLKNGYPRRLIRSVIQKRVHQPSQHNSRHQGLPTLVVPYIHGISERLMVLAKTLLHLQSCPLKDTQYSLTA
ncbi:hypothetical protein M514_01317, partial [Trichuris suis]